MAFFMKSGFSGARSFVRNLVKSRDLFLHDGATMRRVHLSARTQIAALAGLFIAGAAGVAGAGALAVSAPSVAKSMTEYAARTSEVAAMEDRVAALQSEVASIRKDAQTRAAMLAKRQAALASMLTGKANEDQIAALLSFDGRSTVSASGDVLAAYAPVNAQQLQMAAQLRQIHDQRFQKASAQVARLGLSPSRLMGGMGGPYEPVTPDAKDQKADAAPQAPQQADPQFRALFVSWKRLDDIEQGIGGIPSQKPIKSAVGINSGFGVRSDPFRGNPAMHAGVDMPGPHGTPIYATADGIVGRSGRVGGYGNLIELEHGRGIQTRYGHLSSILVAAGTRVKRGQLIGLMGSTGRSTGNHLHYEVRIDGRAVNPIPFLQSGDYLIALQNRAGPQPATAVGGPAKAE